MNSKKKNPIFEMQEQILLELLFFFLLDFVLIDKDKVYKLGRKDVFF